MEVDSLWNTATYAAIAVAGLLLYLFYTCVITCLCVLVSCAVLNLHVDVHVAVTELFVNVVLSIVKRI